MDAVSTFYLTQGVLGATVVVLSLVVVKLYNKTERLEKEKTELLSQHNKEDKETLKEVTAVMNDTSQNMRILSEKIEVGKNNTRGQM